MRKIKILLLTLIISTCHIQMCAASIEFTATVSQNLLVLGESTQLRLQVVGTQDISPMKLPDIEGLNIQYIGPSRQVSMVNGNVKTSIVFTYSIMPTKTGTLTIPGLKLTVAGEDYVTAPIALEVMDGAADTQEQSVKLEDRIYLDMNLTKKEAFINEGIPVKFTFYVSGIEVIQVNYPEFDVQGLIMEPFTRKPKKSQMVKDGLRFNVVEFNTVIYPTRTGELKVDPAELNVTVDMSMDRGRSGKGLFSDAVFNHFFTNQARTFTLRSNEDVLTVKPLPEKNKPEPFSNAVGDFDFIATVSPTDVNAGDPLTISMQLRGEGNLKAVDMPRYSESNVFRSYDPVVKESDGVKTLEQVLIPKTHSVEEVPAIVFYYFDPETGRYKEKVQGPFAINVRKSPGGNGLNVAGFNINQNQSIKKTETFGEDIVYLKEKIGSLSPRGKYLHINILFIVFGFVLAVIYGYCFYQFGKNQRLARDQGYAKRCKAKKRIKKEMIRLTDMAKSKNTLSFYDNLARVLQHYVADILNVSVGIITADEIEQRDELNALDAESKTMIRHILQECDQVRFAGVECDSAQLENSLNQFQKLTNKLSKYED